MVFGLWSSVFGLWTLDFGLMNSKTEDQKPKTCVNYEKS